jgi:uncharacterized protein (DUF1015 family)
LKVRILPRQPTPRTAIRSRDERIYVVDGQHRIEALMRLYLKRDVPDEKWGDFRLSITFMLGATELEEMEQFYVVNSTAKSVRTDLAYDLLKQRAESNPDLIRSLDENNPELEGGRPDP